VPGHFTSKQKQKDMTLEGKGDPMEMYVFLFGREKRTWGCCREEAVIVKYNNLGGFLWGGGNKKKKKKWCL